MYPHNYFTLFPAFPRRKRIFVAMSFDSQMDARWKSVIAPAISAVESDGVPLESYRVDVSRASDAILTEILENIGSAVMVLADITATSELNGKAVRNANVMYEIGIAHAIRLPEEVLLLRSDAYRLDFDIAGVRVHSYDPDKDPSGALAQVAGLIRDNLQSVKMRAHLAVEAALQRITQPAIMLLFHCRNEKEIRHPVVRTIGQSISGTAQADAISLLLELGALQASITEITVEMIANMVDASELDSRLLYYSLTPFGETLLNMIVEKAGVLKPAVVEQWAKSKSARKTTSA